MAADSSIFNTFLISPNNTAAIIADGFGIVDIGLWITGALTKIVAQFTVNSEGAVSSGGFSG